MAYEKNNSKKMDYMKLIPFFILLAVSILSTGFSALYASMRVDNASAYVVPSPDIRITGISYLSSKNGGVSNSASYNSPNIYVDVSLPNANSTITYNITIRNLGNTEMTLTRINNMPTGLTYTLNNFVSKDPLCDDNDPTKCKLGSTTTLSVTFLYDKNGYNANSTEYSLNLEFVFNQVVWVAQIGNVKYGRVQKAVDSVPKNSNTTTTINILSNVTEYIAVENGQSINLNIGNYTLNAITTGNSGKPVIETEGAIIMTNGTISSAASQGAINVHPGGSFNMSGGSIVATGSRQAIYNNGGTVTISGSAYLSNISAERGTVQNLNNGNLTILGGTIVSSNYSAVVQESGTFTLGAKDSTVSTTIPSLQGRKYGVYNYNGTSSTNFNFYDGKLLGLMGSIYDDSKVVDTENSYGVVYQTENISGLEYEKAICALLSNIVTVTFDFNDETGQTSTRSVESGTAIGTPPTRTRTGYVFDGWYDVDGVTEINGSTTVTEDTRFYAHWVPENEYFVARIGDNYYATFAAAIAAVTTNTTTTIELIRNTTGNVTIERYRNIILDFGNHTLSSEGDAAVIVNKGNCTLISGTISTASQSTAAINNESTGNFTISGGSILATGKRQSIYNNGGSVTISGTAYLRATTTERATVHNFKAGGTITITGGTIISPNFSAVNNAAGTLIVGTQGGGINTSTPILRGATYGVQNSATFNFYDGTLYGVTNAISGSVSSREQNSTITNTTEVIDNITYKKAYLQ